MIRPYPIVLGSDRLMTIVLRGCDLGNLMMMNDVEMILNVIQPSMDYGQARSFGAVLTLLRSSHYADDLSYKIT